CLLILFVACQRAQRPPVGLELQVVSAATDAEKNGENVPDPVPQETPYPGRTIDQIFPVVADHSFEEPDFVGKKYSVRVNGLKVNVRNFRPLSISRDNRKLLNFKTAYIDDYTSNAVGKSHLLGSRSTEVHISTYTGAICCGEDWIADVSK